MRRLKNLLKNRLEIEASRELMDRIYDKLDDRIIKRRMIAENEKRKNPKEFKYDLQILMMTILR